MIYRGLGLAFLAITVTGLAVTFTARAVKVIFGAKVVTCGPVNVNVVVVVLSKLASIKSRGGELTMRQELRWWP
jgi:hypothetical protein